MHQGTTGSERITMKYNCKCPDPGNCVISAGTTAKYCGITGLADFKNVKIIKGKVICVNCEETIYKEEK